MALCTINAPVIHLLSKFLLLHILYLSTFLFAFLVNWYSAGNVSNFFAILAIFSFFYRFNFPFRKNIRKKGSNGNVWSIQNITPTNY